MQKVVVLTGAGISAESGIKTFRDSNGLWEEYKIEDVATYDAWQNNRELVLEFYNQRRKQLLDVNPNSAHFALVELEKKFDVQIITQNVDDLHERAGSSKILHLHGELKKSRSTVDPKLIYEIEGWELKIGDKCSKGSQLRPHIVWFGESVPNITIATEMVKTADICIVIGTSMQVYPAAGLISFVSRLAPKYYIDPKAADMPYMKNLKVIKEKATLGVKKVVDELMS